MGGQGSKEVPIEKFQKRDENEVLFQATKISKELMLYETENQLREQRHLIARILLYGHGHIITHLKKFAKEKQKAYIRDLKTIDYEIIDLLYQDLILSRIKGDRPRIYCQPITLRNKKEQKSEKSEKFDNSVKVGKMLLFQKKVAILIFAGGASSRFKDQNGNSLPKQLYTGAEDDKCLLEHMLDKIRETCNEYGKLIVYLVHNEHNHKKINEITGRYSQFFKVKKMIQDQMPIVNLSGKLCIKNQNSIEVLMAPNGCGNFINCTIRSKKFIEDLVQENCQYLYATGISNIAEEVCDPYMVSLLAEDQSIGVAYKCTHPESEGENLPRVVLNKSKKTPEVSNLQNLMQRSEKQCLWDVRRSPVFMNSLYISTAFLEDHLKKAQQKLGMGSILYEPHKIKCDFWNPMANKMQEGQHGYIFERDLSDLLVTGNKHSVAVLVEREEEYLPIISLHGEKKWSDSIEQYAELEKRVKPRNTAHFSLATVKSDNEDDTN